jgi:hypothetical protein
MVEYEGTDSKFLDLFVQEKDGTMKKAPRSIFPVRNGRGRRFELPNRGRTVLVRDGRTGAVRQRFTWDGEKFRKEK